MDGWGHGYSEYMDMQEPDIEFETGKLTLQNYIRFLDGYMQLIRAEEREAEEQDFVDWFMGVEKPAVKIAV